MARDGGGEVHVENCPSNAGFLKTANAAGTVTVHDGSPTKTHCRLSDASLDRIHMRAGGGSGQPIWIEGRRRVPAAASAEGPEGSQIVSRAGAAGDRAGSGRRRDDRRFLVLTESIRLTCADEKTRRGTGKS